MMRMNKKTPPVGRRKSFEQKNNQLSGLRIVLRTMTM